MAASRLVQRLVVRRDLDYSGLLALEGKTAPGEGCRQNHCHHIRIHVI